MKIVLSLSVGIAIGAATVGYYALGTIGRAVRSGYVLGWSEKSRNLPFKDNDLGGRVARIERAERRADEYHRNWHKDNPGKSCAEGMPMPNDAA